VVGKTTTPRPAIVRSGCGLESAGNNLLSPWKDYHRPQVLIVRVRDGNASFHLGKITGKLPDISVTTWWGTKSQAESAGLSAWAEEMNNVAKRSTVSTG
jgi:hypothetical protein